jgi:hypothetical protein
VEQKSKKIEMDTRKKTAKLAGLLYFVFAMLAIYGSMYVPSQIRVPGDAMATAKSILDHEFLFRTGVASNIIGLTLFLFLVLLLYGLLKPVNEHHAKLMVGLVMVGIPIDFLGNVFKLAALKILKGDLLKSFEPEAMQDLAMLFHRNYGGQMVSLFWGLWLIPLALLIYKSGFIPRILGILLIINGVAYIINTFTFMLLPDYLPIVYKFMMVFFFVGEIPLIFWLLIKGVSAPKTELAIDSDAHT